LKSSGSVSPKPRHHWKTPAHDTRGETPLALSEGYADWLVQLKGQIAQAWQHAALAVNAELMQLYGRIGHGILQRQQTQGWGAKVIDRLVCDLKDAFPDMRGLSTCNLKYMAFFAQHCPGGHLGSSLLPKCRGSMSGSSISANRSRHTPSA
jgi:hypothetical protein